MCLLTFVLYSLNCAVLDRRRSGEWLSGDVASPDTRRAQSALFNFQSLLVLLLLLICTCTYVKRHFPTWLNRNRTG